MIIAEDRLAAAALPPLRIDQRARINLEMQARVGGNIFRRSAGADPALPAKLNSADFLRSRHPGQLLQIRQHVA